MLLNYLTAACFVGFSLAAPSTDSGAQLNGVQGPYFDGIEGADRAEIAGLLVTLVMKSADASAIAEGGSSDSDKVASRSDISLFAVINGYKDGRLIRQSDCFRDLENGMPHLQVS